MLKVIQVKIQEHTSCRKKTSYSAWFDQSKNKLDQSKIVSAEFLVGPNSSLSPLRIRVSNLLLPLYKGNPKPRFWDWREREIRVPLVPLLVLGFCTQTSLKSMLLIFAVCVNLLWDLWGVFLHINLGFLRRKRFLHLDDQSSCCHWSLKKHKRRCACIWWRIQERRSPWIRSLHVVMSISSTGG